MSATHKDMIRGGYQNKIRFFSPPEKCYEIFACEHATADGKELRLSYANFLQAVTPYSYTPFFTLDDTEAYLKRYKPKFLSKVDVNDDG